MSNFFSNLVDQLKDDDTRILSDGGASAEYTGCIDTGSYALNALLSGSIYGGVPNNKVTAFAGESATGKTFFVLGVVKKFLDDNPNAGVIYFDTEAAVTKQMMVSKGIDPKRVVISEPDTVQKFRHTALKIIETYKAQKESDRQPMMMVLDSMGQLSSTKEIEDTAEGKETKDMTKSGILKATFRVLNLKLARIGVPLIVTNHVYDVIGAWIPTKEMGGGCLTGGTQIITKRGLTNIEDIKIDDAVMTKEGVWRTVLDTHHFTQKEVISIEFEDGTRVNCTPEHKFLVDGKWTEAKFLTENISVEQVRMKELKIKTITKCDKQDVYDISVDQYENYILSNGVITHNSGLKYTASTIVYLSKKKDKDGTEVIGNIIKAKLQKSRFTKENAFVEIKLTYSKGLDRYYGLLNIAEKYNIIKKVSTRYEMPDGSKVFGKALNDNPEKYFTQDVLEKIDAVCKLEFLYGQGNDAPTNDEEELEVENADE